MPFVNGAFLIKYRVRPNHCHDFRSKDWTQNQGTARSPQNHAGLSGGRVPCYFLHPISLPYSLQYEALTKTSENVSLLPIVSFKCPWLTSSMS